MANNFIPWLGSNATTSPQQANYGKIAVTGFEAGDFVKAEDFNAALRMTTLVCAGIASAFGFDTKAIDVSEKDITDAIQAANITLENITANIIAVKKQIHTPSIIAQYVNGQTINADTVTVNTAIDGGSLNIDGTKRIDPAGNIFGRSYNINNDTVIDNNKNISGASLTIGNDIATISAAGDISGKSYTVGNLRVIDNAGNISGESITSKKITSTGTITGNSLDINGRGISAQGAITGDSLTINSVETIDSSRNIKNIDSITANGDITTNGDLSGNNITANGTLTGNSLTTGRINGTYMHIGPNIATTNLTISSNGNITSNSNISANGYINSSGSIKTNSIERITSAGIMFPSKLNLKNISNCAYLASGGDVVISIDEDDGTTGGYVYFGAKIPNLTYSTAEAQKQILLACISIEATGENKSHVFNSVYTAILTGYPNNNQGSVIFHIYSGDGTSIGDSWGQIRLSYQPYSWFSTSNPSAPACYLAYKKNLSFNDIKTSIRVDLYPIATFN